MAAGKCSYMVIGGQDDTKKSLLQPQLYEEDIPYECKSRFLGLMLDDKLSFEEETCRLRDRVQKRINIIKILSNRSWGLSIRTLRAVYLCLIRSLIDYNFFIYNSLTSTRKEQLDTMQNKSLRWITKDFSARPEKNMERCKVETIETRMKKLMLSYMARNESNPLFKTLVSEYIRGLKARREKWITPLSFIKLMPIESIFPRA